MSSSMQAKSSEFKEPDFAYPKTVEADARALLKKAEAMKGDEAAVVRLRAVLEICMAQTQIDKDSAFAQPAFIAAQAKATEGAGKAMLLMFEADKYASIYLSNRWNYDKVSAPLEPYPADVSEWSGEQFRTRIKELVDEAVGTADKAPSTALTVFDPAIEYSKEALTYIPDVKAFVPLKAYDVLKSINDSNGAEAIARSAMDKAAETSPGYFFWATKLYHGDKKLLEIYRRNKDSEAARFLLQDIVGSSNSDYEEYAVNEDSGDSEARKKAVRDDKIRMIRESLEKFPSWYGNASLKNALTRLTRPQISFTYPSMVSPGEDITIECTYSYAKRIDAALYAATQIYKPDLLKKQRKIASAEYTTDATDGKAVLTLKAPEAGNYVLLMTADGSPAIENITVTPFIGFAVNGCKDNVVVAADFNSGMPLPGVSVKSASYRRSSSPVRIGKTGADGFLIADASKKY